MGICARVNEKIKCLCKSTLINIHMHTQQVQRDRRLIPISLKIYLYAATTPLSLRSNRNSSNVRIEIIHEMDELPLQTEINDVPAVLTRLSH